MPLEVYKACFSVPSCFLNATIRSPLRLCRREVHRDLGQVGSTALYLRITTMLPVFRSQDWQGSVRIGLREHQDIWEMLLDLGMVPAVVRSTSLEINQNASSACASSSTGAGFLLTN